MAAVTARDRVEAGFRGEYLDRIPVQITCTVSEYIASKLGYTRLEVLTEPDKELEALRASQEEFPSDVIRVPADPLLPDTLAARRELKTGSSAAPAEPMLADKKKLDDLEARDPRESKSYRPYLEMVARTKDMFPDHPVVALTPGVWSNAAGMRGPETFLFDTRDDPDFVHGLLRFTTDLAKARGEALSEAGTDMLVYGDPNAGCSFLSPKIYREFVKPYHEELADHIKERLPVRLGFHICGYTDPIMEDIAALSLDWFEIDAPSSLVKMKQLARDKMVVRGNTPTDIFAMGTQEDIEDAVRQCIEGGAPGGRYILSPGCAIPWTVKPENAKAFIRAAREYGDRERIMDI